MFNHTVELSAIKYWLLSAHTELVEGRRPALEFLNNFTEVLPNDGIGRQDIADKIRTLGGDYAKLDKTLSHLNAITVAGWLEQDGDRLYPSFPEISHQPATSNRLGGMGGRGSVAKRTQLRVFARDDWTCWMCGHKTFEHNVSLPDTGDWDAAADHVKPYAHGGRNRAENLRTAHHWCNIIRGDRPKPNKLIQEIRMSLRVAIQRVIIENRDAGVPDKTP